MSSSSKEDSESVFAPTVKLRDGHLMPVLGLGTSLYNAANARPEDVRDAVLAAIERGVRHIDCARNYMNEDQVGAGIATAISRGLVRRDELFVTTKLPPNCMSAPADVEEALSKSLEDLQLDYIDLYLIHFPVLHRKGASVPPAREDILGYHEDVITSTWHALEKCVRAGRVRSLGVSNFSTVKLQRLEEIATIPPVTNQVEMHPYCTQKAMREWCAERGMVVTAFAPLGSPGRTTYKEDTPPLLRHPTIVAIAEAQGVKPAQVALAWSRQRGAVTIPKSVTPSRILENLQSVKVHLTEDQLEQIDAMDQNLHLFTFKPFMPDDMSLASLLDEEEGKLKTIA